MLFLIGLVVGVILILLSYDSWDNRKERKHCPNCLSPHSYTPKNIELCNACSESKRIIALKNQKEEIQRKNEWLRWYKYSKRQYLIRTQLRSLVRSKKTHNKRIETKDIQSLTGREFELHMVKILKSRGFRNVIATPPSNDKGIDIQAIDIYNKKVIFECKRWKDSNHVGSPPVRKFIGAIVESNADKGYFITTSDFTREARAIKGIDRLELWRYDDFISDFQNEYDKSEYNTACSNPDCNSQITHNLNSEYAMCSDCGKTCEGKLHLTGEQLTQILSLGDDNCDVDNIMNFIHHYYCIECSAPMIDSRMKLDGDFGVTANIEKKYNYLESGIQDIKILSLTLLPQTPSLFNGLVCSNNKCSFHQIPNYNSPNNLSELDKILSKRGETSIQKSYERAIKAHQKEEKDRLWEMNRTVLVFSETSPIIEVVKRRYGEGYLIESKGKEYSIPKGIQIETLNRSECERLIAFVEEERKKVQEKQNRQGNSRRRNRRY